MNENINHNLLPDLFRVEYTKMTAVLCRLFGLQYMEIAEDIASETFLKAMELWAIKGLPENPTAWLYMVAKNKTRDYLKRNSLFEREIKAAVKTEESQTDDEPVIDFTKKNIGDSQLEMIFAVCNPVISEEAQICLALQILCGFSVEEIADAFMSKKETIKKRLLRARDNLRSENFRIRLLDPDQIKSRLDAVMKTLYLLFNEGYFSRSHNLLIRKDLCFEAVRLGLALVENPLTDTPKTNALLSLMCFQSSRMDARIHESKEAVLFEQQDKSLWNKELIEKGIYYLIRSCSGDQVSKYHIEARIAYWHTSENDADKWENILQLYNYLLMTEYSPVVALNRTFALSKVMGAETAITEAEKLNLTGHLFYHSLLGNLYTNVDNTKAGQHFQTAMGLTKSKYDRDIIARNLANLAKEKKMGKYS